MSRGVSRNPTDRLKPTAANGGVPVKMPIIHIDGTDTLSQARCSCGWQAHVALRAKVSGERAQRHLDKKHGGQGLWL